MKNKSIKTPFHYSFKIKDMDIDVNDILTAIDNKLQENSISCSRMEWNYYFQALKYLMRYFFKDDKKLNVEKCISELQQMREII